MNREQITEYFNNCYTEHGPDGDQSLEYIGLVFSDGSFGGVKEYRRLSQRTDEDELASDYKDSELFSKVVRYARIYDFSRRIASDGQEYTRIVFAPFKSVLASEGLFDSLTDICGLSRWKSFITDLIRYYDDTGFTGHSPLLKMGLEFTADMKLKESKLYFALRSYDDKNDSIGRRFRYSECAPLVEQSLRLLGMEQCNQAFYDVSAKLEKIGYYPVFTGVNLGADYSEMKVYYETCLEDYSHEKVLNAENALCGLMIKDADMWKELNGGFIGKDLFLDCVSYSLTGTFVNGEMTVSGDIWKPYYLVGSDDLKKHRQIDRYCYNRDFSGEMDPEDWRSVLLVNDKDEPLGIVPKMQAHTEPRLHRAFSVFLYDKDHNMLLQRRALNKYHSPGLWTNACCSHPITGLICDEAAQRVEEELGISCSDLEEIFEFTYRAEVGNGLVEYEFDHVLAGLAADEVKINRDEVEETCVMSLAELKRSLDETPEKYTAWFRLAAPRVIEYLAEKWGVDIEDRR